ncbi:hypothetical protein RB653_001598 [Dictyostelium firmibasis]|uniref:Uncharacterized protein n=1 Tax=Dictyostelium firmibasis TaxID=79012 RepID=A0AAN7U4B6_9MYCE
MMRLSNLGIRIFKDYLAPVELKIGSCQSACESVIKISQVTCSTSKFTFNQYGNDDAKCAAKSTSLNKFTCADGTSKVPIGETTYSVVCVPDKTNSSESDSSDSSRVGASFALFALGLIPFLSL